MSRERTDGPHVIKYPEAKPVLKAAKGEPGPPMDAVEFYRQQLKISDRTITSLKVAAWLMLLVGILVGSFLSGSFKFGR